MLVSRSSHVLLLLRRYVQALENLPTYLNNFNKQKNMDMLNQLLETDPNYILIGLIASFFVMEMAFNKPTNIGGKFKYLIQNFLFQLIVIAMASLLGYMIITTFDWIRRR